MKLWLPFSLLLLLLFVDDGTLSFMIEEATIDGIHKAFKENKLSSRELVKFYLNRTRALNPMLHAVIELNPDALSQAEAADKKREDNNGGSSSGLQGIPILLKDNIGTADRLNTTAGSLALVGSRVPGDAGVVAKLRLAGAIILGKASLSEWASARSLTAPSGWCARSGQGKNPYILSGNPCGSSSGSSIAVAANLAMVALGTDTEGSILCPCSYNSVVGIRPTVGLTSRSGVIPISLRQDTVGPICRTVSDAVHVLDAIVGVDPKDPETTKVAKFIPTGGYKQFLKPNGLRGKRLGVLRNFFNYPASEADRMETFENHFDTLRQRGAIVLDNLEIENERTIVDIHASGELTALLAEFKISLNMYLPQLHHSPIKSLGDVVAFNNNHSTEEKTEEYGQEFLLDSEKTNGIGEAEKHALENMGRLSREGIERLMQDKSLDAVVTPEFDCSIVLAKGGNPGITVPAGYDDSTGMPFGICFGGLKGFEPKLIEIAYGFEQATKIRKPPTFKP